MPGTQPALPVSMMTGTHQPPCLWIVPSLQTKDAAKMNLTTFAAAQYAYGDRVLNEQTYTSNKAGKVSNICSTMEPNKDIALRLKNWCLGTDVSGAVNKLHLLALPNGPTSCSAILSFRAHRPNAGQMKTHSYP